MLIACEFSGVVRDAFVAAGHDAVSCDLLPTEQPGPHMEGDVLTLISAGDFDLMIAHPPCTYLTNAGVRHLHDHAKPARPNRKVYAREPRRTSVSGSARWVAMFAAAEFFNALWRSPIPRIAVENPIPHKYARALIGPYTQIVQPWQFGHGETKATCLWLKNLPPLQPTQIVDGRTPRVHHASPGPDRWKERSRFLPGIAAAMAAQWGTPALERAA